MKKIIICMITALVLGSCVSHNEKVIASAQVVMAEHKMQSPDKLLSSIISAHEEQKFPLRVVIYGSNLVIINEKDKEMRFFVQKEQIVQSIGSDKSLVKRFSSIYNQLEKGYANIKKEPSAFFSCPASSARSLNGETMSLREALDKGSRDVGIQEPVYIEKQNSSSIILNIKGERYMFSVN